MTDAKEQDVFARYQKILLLAVFALLIMLRLPEVWRFGRFLCEEGTIFLAYAWHRPASEALWRSFAGYMNLGANASTLLTVKLVRWGVTPVEIAPYVTMVIATLFQLIPAILILTGRGQWLGSRRAVISCLLIVAISPVTEEVFANVLHIQFHLALSAGLILALDVPATRSGRLLYWVPLFFAPLCGPGAIILLPLFGLRAVVDKDVGRLVQTGVLGAAAALQLLVFYTSSPLRGALLDPATLANLLFVRLGVMPFLSAPVANLYGHQVYVASLQGGFVWWAMAGAALVYFAALIGFALQTRKDPAIWLISSGVLISVISFGAGMLPIAPNLLFMVTAAERYNFLPLTLIGMGLVALSTRTSMPSARGFRLLCTLFLVSSAITYAFPIVEMAQGPDWRTEVAKWRADPEYRPAIWPGKWRVDLTDHDRPCPRVSSAHDAASVPSYCEGSWMARVLQDSEIRPSAPQR